MHELTFAASRLGHELHSHELRLMAHEGREWKQAPAQVMFCFRAFWRYTAARFDIFPCAMEIRYIDAARRFDMI